MINLTLTSNNKLVEKSDFKDFPKTTLEEKVEKVLPKAQLLSYCQEIAMEDGSKCYEVMLPKCGNIIYIPDNVTKFSNKQEIVNLEIFGKHLNIKMIGGHNLKPYRFHVARFSFH